MSCVLAGYSLTVQSGSFSEDVEKVGVEIDSLIRGKFHRVQHNYGKIFSWAFTCLEEKCLVSWASSPAKALEAKVSEVVSFALMYEGHTFAGDVYLNRCRVKYGPKMTIRYYDIQVREV